MWDEAQKVMRALAELGRRRLTILAAVGVGAMILIGGASFILSRPQYEVLYAGLDVQDSTRVVGVMREANLAFDISADGGTVLVEYGQAARARMLLAERGLPRNASAGYELFDKLGSLGLTSFMQEVTRVRALEGELARSIQSMQGVRAARVHLVLADEGSFRKSRQVASASVVVRFSSAADVSIAQAIRHLVAAATPGMGLDAVTVLTSEGTVLSASAGEEPNGPANSVALERRMSEMLQDNVRRTLGPVVGVRNLNVSIVVRFNTDKRQINETTFNPESRVERSVRVTKESQTSQNSGSQGPTSVERNIPNDKSRSDGRTASEDNQKKEELTNYEVSSKSVATTAGGYSIEKLSVAVVVNRAGLVARLGSDASQDTINQRLAEINELAATAAGVSKDRGDVVKVAAVEFAGDAAELEAVAGPGLLHLAARQLGSIFGSLAVVAIVLLVSLLGLRPLARSLAAIGGEARDLASGAEQPALPVSIATDNGSGEGAGYIRESPRKIGQRRLTQFVDADEEQAAAVLSDWVRPRVEA